MKTLAERLTWAIANAGITKADLSRACGVTRGGVTHWFNGGTQKLEGENLMNAAKATGVNPIWLATGQGERLERKPTATVTDISPKRNQVPLLDWDDKSLCSGIIPDLTRLEQKEMLPSPKPLGPNAFALTLVENVMVGHIFSGKNFSPNSYIYIDPDHPLRDGCPVIAKLRGQNALCGRTYAIEGGKTYLIPMNPQLPAEEMTPNDQILGVIVGYWADL